MTGIFNDFVFELKTKKLCNFKVAQFGIFEKHGCLPHPWNETTHKTAFYLAWLPWGKKRKKSFLRYISHFLSHSVDFFSTIYSNIVSFFRPHFWGVQALVTLIFHAFFAFRPLKKGLKSHRGPQNWKFNHGKLCPKPWHYLNRCHILGTFSPPKVFFEPTTQNNIFGSFFALNFFGLKKTNL